MAALLSLGGVAAEIFDRAPVGEEAPRELPVLDLPEQIGEFRIEGVLGRGGMGVVYRAATRDGRKAALKILTEAGAGTTARRRLEREGEALRRLAHSGIARFYDAGTFTDPSGRSLPYVAMELVEGKPLREHLRERPRDLEASLDLLIQFADALDHAHSRGIVHRDLKPENLLVEAAAAGGSAATPSSDWRLRILDFGVARLADPENEERTLMTRVGQLVGTPQYMSPEQAQATGEPVDGRADLYAFGVIAYEILAGKLPYEVPRDSLHRAVVSILTAEIDPLSSHDRRLAGGLEGIVARCLEKKPADRYAGAAELAEDLRRVREGKPVRHAAAWRKRPAARRRVIVGGAAVVAALAALLLGARVGWIPAEIFGSSGDDTFWALAPDLVSANDLLHAGGRRTREEIAAAIEKLEDCQRRLASMPRPAYVGYLESFIGWRLGEAHYFRGTMDHDVKALFTAYREWENSLRARERARHPEKMVPKHAITGEIQRLGRHHPLSALGMTILAVAEHEDPAERYPEATRLYRWALDAYRDPSNYLDAAVLREEDRRGDLGIILHGIASSLAETGRVTGELDLLDQAIAAYGEADSAWSLGAARTWATSRPPLASMLLGYARAYRYRAEITGSLADVDSGLAKAREALSLRTPAEARRAHARTRIEMARLHRIAAGVGSAPSDRAVTQGSRATASAPSDDAWEAGLRELDEARAVMASDEDDADVRAEIDEEEARTLLAIASRTAARSFIREGRAFSPEELLDRADSLRAAAATFYTVDRFPVHQPELDLLGARILLERARRGDAAAAREAAAILRTAIERVPESLNPGLHRRLRALRESM